MNEIPLITDNGEPLPILQEILIRVITIENILQSNASPNAENVSEQSLPDLNWTASKTDLIELIYALYANKTFNHGKVTIKAITHFFESTLDIKLGNTSLTFQEILRRKDSIAFLDQIRASLKLYISRIDEKPAR